MGTQIVCQDGVWTEKICMGSVCFDKLYLLSVGMWLK